MSRILRYSVFFVLAILAINIVGWYISGRSQVLALAERGFDGWGTLNGSDTLFVYAHYSNELPELLEPGNFSPSTRDKLYASFVEAGKAAAVVYQDSTFLPTDEQKNKTPVLYVGVSSGYPLYAEVLVSVFDSGFIANRTQKWIWFFGWHPIGQAEESVS